MAGDLLGNSCQDMPGRAIRVDVLALNAVTSAGGEG